MIVLQLSPKGLISHEKFEWASAGIEVLRVADAGESEIVTLHIPEGRLAFLERKIEQYLTVDNRTSGAPRNARLVNVIDDIRAATFTELWTSSLLIPAEDQPAWFQIWLRIDRCQAQEVRDEFAEEAARFDIIVERGFVTFPGRVVVAARTTRRALESALDLLDRVAEIRPAEETAQFFLSNLNPAEQVEWTRDLVRRTTIPTPQDTATYVTLLDTGVNHAHPLIGLGLSSTDLYAIDQTWSTGDQWGHGSQMAGLLLHGDLVAPLASAAPNAVGHRLESVKILPDVGANPPHLYGWITSTAINIVESKAPERVRVFAMMTSAEGYTTGMPTEWSATVDRLAFGSVDAEADDQERMQTNPRLVVLSGGNVPWDRWADYPNENDLRTIESPGQSWNAITVGAYTDLAEVDVNQWPSLSAIALPGSLSPSSTTSVNWPWSWPSKPDVVAEGGNGCLEDGTQVIVGPESLRLLTTSHSIADRMFVETGDTSAAAAEVARLCAQIRTRYPEWWPETVRALVVHGARYTSEMLKVLPKSSQRKHKEVLRRRYGHGLIQPQLSLSSNDQRATLVLQRLITPYRRDGSQLKLNALHMHELPWPRQILEDLGHVPVTLRTTLSYFIDPNPSQRGWQGRFRYQSHGLRFALQGATESMEEFSRRINKVDRMASDDPSMSMPDPDVDGWAFGSHVCFQGSIHSDVWEGTGAQLAAKSGVAVFPVGGWWKDWKANPYAGTVRYALVLSIEVPVETEVDIYSPIADQIRTPVAINVQRQ